MSMPLKVSLLSFSCVAIMYVDRAVIANAMILMRKEFPISESGAGIVFSSFAWGYVLGMPIAGLVGSRYSTRLVVTVSCLLWTTAMLLMATATSTAGLIGSRFLLGLCEAPVFPCLARVVAENHSVLFRARATAIFDSGSYAGPIIAGPWFVFVSSGCGWRSAIMILAALSGLFGIVWWLLAPVPLVPVPTTHAVRNMATIKEVCGDPRLQLVSAGFFCYNFAKNFLFTWLPMFVVLEWGQSGMFAASIGSMCFLFGLLGLTLSSVLTDRSIRSGGVPLRNRAVAASIGLLIGGLLALVPMARPMDLKYVLLLLAAGGIVSAASAIWAIPSDLAATASLVPVVGAAQNTVANLANIIAPLAIGWMRTTEGRFTYALGFTGAMSMFGALLFSFLSKVANDTR